MKKDLTLLKKYHLNQIHEELTSLKDTDYRWNFWREYNPTSGCLNVGIFIYEENMYHLAEYAQRGGIITGSRTHFDKLNKLGYPVSFHSWYQDNVFIQIATIPQSLTDLIDLMEKQAKLE